MPRNPWGAPPPRWLTPVTPAEMRRGDGDLYADVVNACGRIVKDSIAGAVGAPLVMRPWQRQLLRRVFARRADGMLKHRTALIGMPRKNGKSALISGVAIADMLLDPGGGEMYSCAGDKAQAAIIFDTARQMILADPELSSVFKTYRSVIECPTTGALYRVLSAEAFTKEGLNPTRVYFDELHVQPNRELWNVMQQAMGARPEPLLLAITTAGVMSDTTGQDSICYTLYQHGREVAMLDAADPTFFMAWWEPRDPHAPHDSPRTWRETNPGYGDIVAEADFRSVVARAKGAAENDFRIKRVNQWVSSGQVWLPAGAWEAIAEPDRYPGGPPDRTRVVLAFDGSMSGDSTALIGITVEDRPHVFVVGIWEKDPYDPHWTVPREVVEDTLRAACILWDVPEIAYDEFLWQDSFRTLAAEGLPVEPYPQSPERMGAATQGLFESVVDSAISHDGDPVLARHVRNAVPKPTSRGLARIVKDKPDSPRKIDGAVTAVFGLDRAWWHLTNRPTTGFNIW